MDRAPSAPSTGGFLYVEALLAMVLMAFVILSLAPMFILAADKTAAAGDQTLATTLAHDQAEMLKRLPYDLLASGADEIQQRAMTYDRTWTINNDMPHPGMRTVIVTVTPRRVGGHGGNRVVSLSFYRVPQ